MDSENNMEDEKPVEVHESLYFKQLGNDYYRNKKYDLAIEQFTKAISIDNNNSTLFCNRGMCYAALLDWDNSIRDSSQAIAISSKNPNESPYVKAYYHLVNGYINLNKIREAKMHLLIAFNVCGNKKELKQLEDQLNILNGCPIRPGPSDFVILEEIGDGNFTKVYKAKYKYNDNIYAIKTIEKTNAERMKRRHPNINNEIMMEKKVLNKLNHPNIVLLYSTFQDFGTLYYQMEYLPGGELWTYLKDSNQGLPVSVGCYHSKNVFYIAEMINAIEYMHRKGIVHRDIKPENIMINEFGHLKFVDFGTAKDLIDTDLNGPNFVGTAEFMSPSTIRSKPSGIEIDLWALGVTIFQLYTGFTPFAAASPYITFLRIKRANLKFPSFISNELKSLIGILLTKDDNTRVSLCTGVNLPDNYEFLSNKERRLLNPIVKNNDINYDVLRNHPFFNDLKVSLSIADNNNDYITSFKEIHNQIAITIPSLKELCLRAVGRACLVVSELTSKNGGVKPNIPWIQKFNLPKLLSKSDLNYIKHYLERCNRLHPPSIYRLFFDKLVDARLIRTDISMREYIGFDKSNHAHWKDNHLFIHLTDPLFGYHKYNNILSNISIESDWSVEENSLRKAISSINRIRPKFVVLSGNLTCKRFDEEGYDVLIEAFRRTMARVSDTIPVLYMPGSYDIGEHPTEESLENYKKYFGADFYGFWYSGVRCLVLNSTLLRHPEDLPNYSKEQEEWFDEEIEIAKLSSTHVLIFTNHPWFINYAEEDDTEESLKYVIPKDIRLKWLKKLKHSKVKYLYSGNYNKKVQSMANLTSQIVKKNDEDTSDKESDDDDNKNDNMDYTDMKPSEIISHGLKTGELTEADVLTSNHNIEDNSETNDLNDNSNDIKVNEKVTNNDSDSDSDKEGFVNEDAKYQGPSQIICTSISSSSGVDIAGLHLVKVYEDNIENIFYEIDTVPKQVSL